MMPLKKHDDTRESEFRNALAENLRRGASRFSSEAAAARDLGISKQRFQQYLEKRATPHADFLIWAMARWRLPLKCYGVDLRVRASAPVQRAATSAQLNLFDEPHLLNDDRVQVRLGRKRGDSLRVTVDIKMAS